MVSVRLVLTVVVLLLCGFGVPAQQIITPHQAMQAVRDFEGDNALQLKCWPLEEDTEGPEWAHMWTYDVDDTQNEEHQWTVQAVRGEVIVAIYGDASETEWLEDPVGPLTQQECHQIAESFARSKYAGFDSMGLQPGDGEWTGYGWEFSRDQQVAYGAWTPNHVTVEVNPVDGRIQSYVCIRIPTPAAQQPQITAQQAIDALKDEVGIVTVTNEPAPTLGADPDGTTWYAEIEGPDAQGKHRMFAGEVDAVTGQVVDTAEATWGGPTPATGSAKSGDREVLARSAAAKKGYALSWNSHLKQLRAAKGLKQVVMLQVGSRTATVNGRKVSLESAPRIENGRMMIPASALSLFK